MIKHSKTVVTLVVVAVASASAAAWATRPVVSEGHACLAVGSGICFSGSTDWVARAAGAQLIAAQRMDIIVADAQ